MNAEAWAGILGRFKGDVSGEHLAEWLEQFDLTGREAAEVLLQHFRYYSARDVCDLLEKLWGILEEHHGVTADNAWFVPTGYVAKSGDAVAYFFRRINGLPEESFLRCEDLTPEHLKTRQTVVFVDDFVGTGMDAVEVATDVAVPLQELYPDINFIFAAVVGYTSGIERARGTGVLELCVAEELPEATKPFTANSDVFPQKAERERYKSIVKEYGERLKPGAPLGYGETQGLVGFFFGTPNNTLPVFWSAAEDWMPLLPYGDSLRDPNRLLGVPGIIRNDYPDGEKPTGFATALDDLELSPEATDSLFRCFQTLQNMIAAAIAFSDLGLSQSAMGQLVEAIDRIGNARHEGAPIMPAILFASNDCLDEIMKSAMLRLDPKCTLHDLDKVAVVAQILDGLEGAVVVDTEGQVHGLALYTGDGEAHDMFTPQHYTPICEATRRASGVAVLFGRNQRVTIFHRGRRILTRRFGKWHVQAFPGSTHQLEADKGLIGGVLANGLRLALLLSDLEQGAMFTLGDHEGVLNHASKTAPAEYEIKGLSVLREDDDGALIALARQDGALVFHSDGHLVQSMTMLHPPPDAMAEEEAGKGARHTTAAKISAASEALVIAVSEDGPITLYSSGQRMFRFMG